MIFPWTSQAKLERLRDDLGKQLKSLRKNLTKKKRNIKPMEKQVYWGGVSIGELKAARKALSRTQRRIIKINRKLRKIDERLGGDS